MKQLEEATSWQILAGEIQVARIQLAQAESSVESAREQARLAKRKRKEAKRAARHAKKRVKEAKAECAKAKDALAEAEGRMAEAREREDLARKTRKGALASSPKEAYALPGLGRPSRSSRPPAPKQARTKAAPKARDIAIPQGIEAPRDAAGVVSQECGRPPLHPPQPAEGS